MDFRLRADPRVNATLTCLFRYGGGQTKGWTGKIPYGQEAIEDLDTNLLVVAPLRLICPQFCGLMNPITPPSLNGEISDTVEG